MNDDTFEDIVRQAVRDYVATLRYKGLQGMQAFFREVEDKKLARAYVPVRPEPVRENARTSQ